VTDISTRRRPQRRTVLLCGVAGALILAIGGVFVFVHTDPGTLRAAALSSARQSVVSVAAGESKNAALDNELTTQTLAAHSYAKSLLGVSAEAKGILPGGDIDALRAELASLSVLTKKDAAFRKLNLANGVTDTAALFTTVTTGHIPVVNAANSTRDLNSFTAVENGRIADRAPLIAADQARITSIETARTRVDQALSNLANDVGTSYTNLTVVDSLAGVPDLSALQQTSSAVLSATTPSTEVAALGTYFEAVNTANIDQVAAVLLAKQKAEAAAAAAAARNTPKPTPTPTPTATPTPTGTPTPDPTGTPSPTPTPTAAP
jgi:hypothetical protein